MQKFYCPQNNDKRIYFACKYLEAIDYEQVNDIDKCDFVLMGVNPSDFQHYTKYPVFAGNVCANNVFDYTKSLVFAQENAYLTSEGAIAVAIKSSDISINGSKILIIGYGRIAQSLHYMLNGFHPDITVCARNPLQLSKAKLTGARFINFDSLMEKNDFDFVFNTVPHPVLNEKELNALKQGCIIIDLASFPGGVDTHYAKLKNINVITARGLPALYSPKSAGIIVAKSVVNMLDGKEVTF